MNTETNIDNLREHIPLHCLCSPKSTIQGFDFEKMDSIACFGFSWSQTEYDIQQKFRSLGISQIFVQDSSSLESNLLDSRTETTLPEEGSMGYLAEAITDEEIYDSMIDNDISFSMGPVAEYKVQLKIKKIGNASPVIFDSPES